MINTIRWSKNGLMIDNRDVISHFEDAYQKAVGSNKSWPYKNEVYIQRDEIEHSKHAEGEYMIFVSEPLFHDGFEYPEDIGLSAVQVTHQDQTIIWQMDAPEGYQPNEEESVLTFTFDKQQYLAL